MATKGKSTRVSSAKKKSTAREHANQRTMRQMNEPDPRTPRSTKEVSQGRFPGETPLTGEDRPATRSGGKQRGYRGPALTGRDVSVEQTEDKPFIRAPAKKRRPTSRDRNR